MAPAGVGPGKRDVHAVHASLVVYGYEQVSDELVVALDEGLHNSLGVGGWDGVAYICLWDVGSGVEIAAFSAFLYKKCVCCEESMSVLSLDTMRTLQKALDLINRDPNLAGEISKILRNLIQVLDANRLPLPPLAAVSAASLSRSKKKIIIEYSGKKYHSFISYALSGNVDSTLKFGIGEGGAAFEHPVDEIYEDYSRSNNFEKVKWPRIRNYLLDETRIPFGKASIDGFVLTLEFLNVYKLIVKKNITDERSWDQIFNEAEFISPYTLPKGASIKRLTGDEEENFNSKNEEEKKQLISELCTEDILKLYSGSTVKKINFKCMKSAKSYDVCLIYVLGDLCDATLRFCIEDGTNIQHFVTSILIRVSNREIKWSSISTNFNAGWIYPSTWTNDSILRIFFDDYMFQINKNNGDPRTWDQIFESADYERNRK